MISTTLGQIFLQAFSPEAVWSGGFIGVLTQGLKRGAFSNEAGIGSAAIAHATARTDQPVREGLVAMLGPFIDTHIVCTMTALTILVTGSYLEPSLTGKGALITAHAFATLHPSMPVFLTVASAVFAYSTIISWSYYGERCVEYLLGHRGITPFRILFVTTACLGPSLRLTHVINFSDLTFLSMAFPNILGMAILSKKVKQALVQYQSDFQIGPWATIEQAKKK